MLDDTLGKEPPKWNCFVHNLCAADADFVRPDAFIGSPFERFQKGISLPPLQGDSKEGVGTPDLQAEFHRLEAALERLRGAIVPSPGLSPSVTPNQLRLMIKARRVREQMLGSQLFADPAWDILLEAYLADMTRVPVSVSGLCQSSAVPATTALRWLQKLEEDGWLARKDDPFDGRRTWIELTAEGSARLSRYFAALDSSALPI